MAVNFVDEAPEILKDYLLREKQLNKSDKTVSEKYLDLRMFFRFMKCNRGIAKEDDFNKISIKDIDLDFIKSITTMEILEFNNYLMDERRIKANGRFRKMSTLRKFFEYLTLKSHLLDIDPIKELDMPKLEKSLPKYLTLEQSIELLNAVEGKYKERDYAILTIFLNCGLRLSELVGLNVTDIRNDNTMRVIGKGSKERVVYLNDACISAIKAYLAVRPTDNVKDKKALFLSSRLQRISPKTVQAMVYKYLEKIGLDSQGYSCHKLRHTAATLMYQHGNVDIRVLKDVLGHENLGTTQIYTHISDKQLEKAANSSPLAKIKPKKGND